MSGDRTRLIVGVDEAGRGPIAGPVIAAAAYLNQEQVRFLKEAGLNDSKRLTPLRRAKLFNLMGEIGVTYRFSGTSHRYIDEKNILFASLTAMRKAVEQLPLTPDLVVVDGTVAIPGLAFPQRTLAKADSILPSVMAASVVAKVVRDRIMAVFDKLYPGYGLAGHKGYPTAAHYRALELLGPTPIHRRSFRGVLAGGQQ